MSFSPPDAPNSPHTPARVTPSAGPAREHCGSIITQPESNRPAPKPGDGDDEGVFGGRDVPDTDKPFADTQPE